MSVKSGFFNSIDGDRKYNALDVSSVFDGVIKDGVFEEIGGFFATVPGDGMTVKVKPGRAWFDHTWTVNSEDLVLTVPAANASFARKDIVVLETNHNDTVRQNEIKYIAGTASANPVFPTLTKSAKVNQYPLARLEIPAGTTQIDGSMITVTVGQSECPFVIGPLNAQTIDQLFANWDNQFNVWFADLKKQMTNDVVTNIQYQIEQIRALNYDVPDAVLTKWGMTPSEIQDKNIASVLAKLFVPNLKTKTLVFTSSEQWTNLDGATQVTLRMFGGGAGGSRYGGGGGGHMYYGTVTLDKDQTNVAINIGAGGASGGAGGTTSFGTYASAAGGSGVNGGSGGGGGGNASYGGGGGGYGGKAGCPDTSSGTRAPEAPCRGGNGGQFGGGGGGGGGAPGYGVTNPVSGANGGSKGAKGGNGGIGGKGPGSDTSGTLGTSGNSGTNTLSTNEQFKGPGYSGSRGNSQQSGGGGGGGYGGNGGNGGNAGNSGLWSVHWGGGGGGGGGGYGANGGNGGDAVCGTGWHDAGGGGGGGGGGYGGNGGNGGNGTEGYKAGATGGSGGGGGYGASGNGGSYIQSSGTITNAGIAAGGYSGYPGGSGIIIMTYSYWEYEYGEPGS